MQIAAAIVIPALCAFSFVAYTAYFGQRSECRELSFRVNQLEEIVCPTRQHEYVLVDKDIGGDYTNATYMCKNCKKIKVEMEH